MYLHETLAILDLAAQMSMQVIDTSNAETVAFLNELRDEIIEQYSTILISVADSEDKRTRQSFQAHLPTICQFLDKTL